MGACLATKENAGSDNEAVNRDRPMNRPLRLLKRELLEKLAIDEGHYFAIFAQYRYLNSYR